MTAEAAGSPQARPPQVVLIGRSGCHLCQEARGPVSRTCAELGASFTELSCDDDPRLAEQWYELLPVVLVNDVVVAHWWVDPAQLRTHLIDLQRAGR